jgi:hypothetical protein
VYQVGMGDYIRLDPVQERMREGKSNHGREQNLIFKLDDEMFIYATRWVPQMSQIDPA